MLKKTVVAIAAACLFALSSGEAKADGCRHHGHGGWGGYSGYHGGPAYYGPRFHGGYGYGIGRPYYGGYSRGFYGGPAYYGGRGVRGGIWIGF